MIEITVDLVKHSTGERECMGKALIVNDGTGGAYFGNYDVTLYRRPGKANKPVVWKRAKVRGFERKKRLAWDLLYLALRQVVGERNR